MKTADFYSSATGTLRVNGGQDENAPKGVSLSVDDLSYIKRGSRVNEGDDGFTPTQAQLDAMNSGITSGDVEQISTNKNNISLQQNTVAEGGNGFAIINGKRLYMTDTTPVGARTGDKWIYGNTIKQCTQILTTNPLCGIDTFKDTLDLSTGACTRYIKKYVLTGQEAISGVTQIPVGYRFRINVPMTDISQNSRLLSISSHFECVDDWTDLGFTVSLTGAELFFMIANISTISVFQSWLTDQYTNGTPITIWYILANSTTETITVPTGLSGTEEGYLIQSETPTPTNPVYPTANNISVWE